MTVMRESSSGFGRPEIMGDSGETVITALGCPTGLNLTMQS